MVTNLTLQKKYLKLQLDPHFVFNSLSSLTGMIEETPKQAEDYVVKLSHTYRYILRHIDCDYTSLSEAADFIKTYVSMLNMRYDGNIELDIADLHTHEDECVLSLSLQLLIENAVKSAFEQVCKFNVITLRFIVQRYCIPKYATMKCCVKRFLSLSNRLYYSLERIAAITCFAITYIPTNKKT